MSAATTFEVVRPYDLEVVKHVEPSALAEYSVKRDLEALALPPEAKPIVFRCRVLSRDQRRLVREHGSEARQRELAFRFGLVEVRNLPRPDGSTESVAPPRAKAHDMLTDEALDALRVGEDDISDVGGVVLARSFLGLGTPLRCPVLDSSQRACIAAISHHAEQKKASETAPESSLG